MALQQLLCNMSLEETQLSPTRNIGWDTGTRIVEQKEAEDLLMQTKVAEVKAGTSHTGYYPERELRYTRGQGDSDLNTRTLEQEEDEDLFKQTKVVEFLAKKTRMRTGRRIWRGNYKNYESSPSFKGKYGVRKSLKWSKTRIKLKKNYPLDALIVLARDEQFLFFA